MGRITLNRPKAINALTHAMIRAIDTALAAWEADPAIRLILLDGAGERGLCAGGDIRVVHDALRAGDTAGPEAFFADEYRLNARIARFPKPFVAFMDGITMGGGIGVSSHASHRVVTERSVLAMPEVGIGFLPDVGGTFLLGRAPGELGLHAALTASRLNASDAILCGLADVHVPSSALPALAERLGGCADARAVQALLAELATKPSPATLAPSRGWIDICYAASDMEEIIAALHGRQEAAAQTAAQEIAGKSPTSLKLTLRAVRAARTLGRLEPCLQQEYDAARACLRGHDFLEGVRAALVDKDRAPAWVPADLRDVTSSMIDQYFEPSPETDLHLG